jgi:hypothetical protein
MIMPPWIDDNVDFTLFGKILLQWGAVETGLRNIVELRGQPVPRHFSELVKAARRVFDENPEALNVLETVEYLNEQRVTIVHGRYLGRLDGGFHCFRFPLKDRVENRVFGQNDLMTLLDEMRDVYLALGGMSDATQCLAVHTL